MLYPLYDHQKKTLKDLRQSFKDGYTRPMLYASVAIGKTVIAAHIVASALDKGKRVMFVVPYTTLINQTAKSFIDQGIPKMGIIQANHAWTNPSKRLQIASIQTLSRRTFPDVDLIIIDEAHILFTSLVDYMKDNDTPIIGLSGSPFTKSLGKYYSNIIKAKPMKELIKEGFLSEYICYAPSKPKLDDIKEVAGEYHQGELAERCSDSKIIGDIVKTWLKHGENRPTVCFAVSVAHANFIGLEFSKVGITNAVMTAKTPTEIREKNFIEFEKGNIKILINVGILIAGFDSMVHVMIDAAPTKSEIRHVQKCGRNLRTAKSKEIAIFLDHAGNMERLGFPDDIDIDELCTGEKKEVTDKEKKEKAEKLPKLCPSCKYLKPAGENICSKCGFIPKAVENVEVEDGELTLIKRNNNRVKYDKADKQRIWSEILGVKAMDKLKGQLKSDGYYSHLYKDLTGVWSRGLRDIPTTPGEQILGFIKHKKIAFAKSKERRA